MLEFPIPLLIVVAELALRFTMVIVVLLRRRGDASARLAWLVVIIALPIIGTVIYLLIGEVRFGRRRIRRHREIVDRIDAHAKLIAAEAHSPRPHQPEQHEQIALLAETVGGNFPHGGNRLQLFADTNLFIQSLVEDIDAATKHCHLLFYIFLPDHSGVRIAEALMRAASRGVDCRLLVDGVGSKLLLRSELRTRLTEAGVRVVEALPASVLRMMFSRVDLRNHRKIVVIDGRIGYTGSHNIADAEFAIKPRFAPWVDVTVRVLGPATRDLHVLFVEDWFLDTGESLEDLLAIDPPVFPDGVIVQVMGTGPSSYNEALHQISHLMFYNAREELVITTPYFVPDDTTIDALRTAARRGIETILVVPARNDSRLVAAASRSFYELLLEAGVNIFEFTGGLLHAKTTTIDRDLALISTANLDRRSFELNFEVSLLVFDDDFASELRFLQGSYMHRATPVIRQQWANRSMLTRGLQNAAGLLSPLL